MWNVLFRARESFARDQRGNVAILFAFTAIPLIALLGGAVDVTRHQRHEMALLNAMDAATIALVRQGELSDAEADKFVNDFIGAMVDSKDDPMLHMASFDATKIEGGYRVSSKGTMDTAFLPVVGMDEMSLNLSTEVMESTGKYEIALALDNTGSMDEHGRIEALRDAAGQLVDDLYKEPGTEDRVEMALIPFVTAVNIKSATPAVPGIVDRLCRPVAEDRRQDGLRLQLLRPRRQPVNRETLFKQMRVDLEGLRGSARRRARRGRHAPDDRRRPAGFPISGRTSRTAAATGNPLSHATATTGGTTDWNRLRDIDKYDVPRGHEGERHHERGPERRPARAPIVELTNDTRAHARRDRPDEAPQRGRLGNNSGTNVAQGLPGAWRVLSPDAPFDQGANYEDKETQKVLVLLSDGRNQVVAERRRARSPTTPPTAISPPAGCGTTQLPHRRARCRRESRAHLRDSQGEGHPPLHDPLPGRFRRDAGPLPRMRLQGRRTASRSTSTSRTPARSRRPLQEIGEDLTSLRVAR